MEKVIFLGDSILIILSNLKDLKMLLIWVLVVIRLLKLLED